MKIGEFDCGQTTLLALRTPIRDEQVSDPKFF